MKPEELKQHLYELSSEISFRNELRSSMLVELNELILSCASPTAVRELLIELQLESIELSQLQALNELSHYIINKEPESNIPLNLATVVVRNMRDNPDVGKFTNLQNGVLECLKSNYTALLTKIEMANFQFAIPI